MGAAMTLQIVFHFVIYLERCGVFELEVARSDNLKPIISGTRRPIRILTTDFNFHEFYH